MSGVDCPYCGAAAELVGGGVIYPHRPDLHGLWFWRCAPCDAHVGCHRAGARVPSRAGRVVSDGTLPLGKPANAELRKTRVLAHHALDSLWGAGRPHRSLAYQWLAEQMGLRIEDCHIGLMEVDACRRVVELVRREKSGRTLQVAVTREGQ